MKIAYRIITPILAVGTIAMGIFLDMFYFAIGSTIEQLNQLMPALSRFNIPTTFSFSIYEIIQILTGAAGEGGETAAEGTESVASAFLTVVDPILPHIIALVVFFVLALLLLLVIAAVSAATEKRNAVIGLSCAGIVVSFICVIIGKFAFDIIIDGENINLSEIIGLFTANSETDSNALMQLLTTLVSSVIKISSAAFSAGLYAVFGMFVLIILWTILTNMLVKTPIHIQKKHRRKKPIKNLSAVFGKK